MIDFSVEQRSIKPTLQKVISGGQTGADVAFLAAAATCGVETGGTMPKGFITLDGPKSFYVERFGIVEHKSPKYPPRTECNVKNADATIQIASDWTSAGEILTSNLIRKHDRPSLRISPNGDSFPSEVARWIRDGGFRVVNGAGNSHKTDPLIGLFTFEFMVNVLKELDFTIDAGLESIYYNAFRTGIYFHQPRPLPLAPWIS